MANDDVAFFAAPGPTSDLSPYTDRIDVLPDNPAALGEVVRGLLLHDFDAEMRRIEFSPERDGMRTFGAGPTLDRVVQLDSASLVEARPENERLIGYCYHFALLHCALLRAKGTPARTRCGFAAYLIAGKWTDHWVVEFWDGQQWRLTDPQVGLDELSSEHFRTGVDAWQLCRAGDADPFDHGIGDLWGWDELRGSLVNDIGSLNKVEIGDWDWCMALQVEPLDQPSADIDDRLDAIADLAGRGAPLRELHTSFEQDTMIRPPAAIVEAASSR